jgi:two-component system sensor histidine kinase KdpD
VSRRPQRAIAPHVRLARALKAPLLAVTVTRPAVRLVALDSRTEDLLRELVRLAEDLGAEVIQVEGRDVAAELARDARQRHVTQIVIGQPTASRWQELIFGSVTNRLLREPTGADVHVVPQQRVAHS